MIKLLKSLRISLFALGMATALAGAVATPALALPAGYSTTAKLPDVHEFREGDAWDAYDAEAARTFHGGAYDSYEVRNGRWVPRDLDFMSTKAPNPRTFTDLAGRTPEFPKNWDGFWAAPDGRIYMPTNHSGQWMRWDVGMAFSFRGTRLPITERMTSSQAAQLTVQLKKAMGFRAKPAVASGAQPVYVNREVHCPDGHVLPQNLGKPAGWQPGILNMVAACAVMASLPL